MESYEEFIANILETRGRFGCGDEYHERHHIIPKCIGGTNDEDNLIDLYAKEHFLAHKLLATENPDNKSLAYAWTMMSWIKRDFQDRYEVTPEEYEEARLRISELRKSRKGVPIAPFTEEHKRKIGDANRGKIRSEEARKRIGEAHKNPSEETRKKMREHSRHISGEDHPNWGKKRSEEERKKMSESLKGRQSPMKGKTHSEKSKEKMSKSKKGKYTGENNPNYGNHKLKGKFMGKDSPRYGQGKSVVQLTINDEFVAEYVSAYEAGKVTGINKGGITQVCTHVNNRKIAGGFHWMFKDEYLTIQQGIINSTK